MTVEVVRNVHPPVAKMMKEVQGYQLDLFTGIATEGLVMDVAGMSPDDTIRSVIEDSTATAAKLPNADFAMHDGRASAHVLFNTVIATDEITVNSVSYVGSDTPTGTQWDSSLATDALQAADAAAKINANEPLVNCTPAGDGFVIRAVSTGAAGNAIDVTSADATITVTTNGTDALDGGNGDAATGTLTCASVIAGDTVTVNGKVYTARLDSVHDTNDPRFFHTGLNDTPDNTECAESLRDAINLRELRNDTVTATSSTNVVTVSAANIGVAGNSIDLAETGGTVTLSGALLTGGTDLGGGFYTVAGGTPPTATTGTIMWIDKK